MNHVQDIQFGPEFSSQGDSRAHRLEAVPGGSADNQNVVEGFHFSFPFF
jgi:hypothetical protein